MRPGLLLLGLAVAAAPAGRAPRRLRQPGAGAPPSARVPASGLVAPDALDAAGAAVRQALPFRTAATDRAVGTATLALLAAVVTGPWVAGAGLVAGWASERWHRSRRAAEEAALLRRTIPEVVDLLRLAVDAGATPLLALQAAAEHVDDPVAGALAEVVRRTAAGDRFDDAVDVLVDELGEPLRPLAGVLRAANLDGAPLAPALTRLGDELRADRRRHAEVEARRLPVRLLFPLVCCALPALVLLSVVPLLVGTLRSLRL